MDYCKHHLIQTQILYHLEERSLQFAILILIFILQRLYHESMCPKLMILTNVLFFNKLIRETELKLSSFLGMNGKLT